MMNMPRKSQSDGSKKPAVKMSDVFDLPDSDTGITEIEYHVHVVSIKSSILDYGVIIIGI